MGDMSVLYCVYIVAPYVCLLKWHIVLCRTSDARR